MFKWVKDFMKKICKKSESKKYFEIKGQGTIKAKDFSAKKEFSLEFFIGEPALLLFKSNLFSKARKEIRSDNLKEFSFFGELDDGNKISIDRLILISDGDIIKGIQMPMNFKVISDISIHRNDFKSDEDEQILFRIANLEFTGCEKTIKPDGGWSVDHMTLNLEGYSIVVKQLQGYKEIEKKLRKKEFPSAETSEIIVNAKHKDKDKVRKIVDDLCWLLSFARGNTVVPFGEIHLKGHDVVHQIFRSSRVEPFRGGDQLIPDYEPLRQFVEEAYPNYQKYKENLRLYVILNYHELMKRNPIMDARCVLGFVLLECLSSNAQEYYKNKGEPVKNSLMSSKVKKLKGILPKHEIITEEIINKLKDEFIYPYPSLQDSINKLMKEFKMKYKKGEDQLFGLRKEFIHKGEFPKDIDPLRVYRGLVHFNDRLILHILGYKGEYLDISDVYKHKTLEYK